MDKSFQVRLTDKALPFHAVVRLLQVVGMLSVKDLLKEVTREKEELMTKITEFKIGRGGFFEHT